MANRRDLIQGGLALAAIAAAPPALSRAAPTGASTIVIADRALPEAAPFSAEAVARGYRVRTFDGDVGPLWMNVIELRLRGGGVSILGVTSAATLFCIETLARDYGARAVARTAVARTAARDAEHGFAQLLAANSPDALPPFIHVLAPMHSPSALVWRIETHSHFRSILQTQG